LFILLVFFFISTTTFFFWKNRQDVWYESEGDKYYSSKNYSKAFTNYLKAEEINDKNGSVRFKIGKLLFEKNIIFPNFGYKGALKELEESKNLGFDGDELYIYLAQTYLLIDSMNSSDLQTDLKGKELENLKSEISEKDWKKEAKKILDDAYQKDKERSAEFFFAKGRSNLIYGDYKFTSSFKDAYEDFLASYNKSKNLETKLFLSASIFPIDSGMGYNLLNEILSEMSDNQENQIFSKAKNIRDIYIQFSTENEVQRFYEFGKVFLDSGFDKTALYFLNRSIQKNSKYTPSYILQGIASYNLNDLILSESSFSIASEQQKFNAEINYYLGKTKERAGDFKGAIEEFQRAINSNFLSENLFLDFGNLYLKIGSETDAENMFRKGLSVNPANWDLRLSLFRLLVDQKRVSEIESEIENVKNIFSEDSFYYEYMKLVSIFDKKENFELAIKFADSALGRNFYDINLLSEIYFYKGFATEGLGKIEDAKNLYIQSIDSDFSGVFATKSIERIEKLGGFKSEKKSFWWWIREIV